MPYVPAEYRDNTNVEVGYNSQGDRVYGVDAGNRDNDDRRTFDGGDDFLNSILNGVGNLADKATSKNSLEDLVSLLTGSWKQDAVKKGATKITRAKHKKDGMDRRRAAAKRSGGGAAYVDPRIAMVNSLLAPQGAGIDPNDKTFRRNNQKQINAALLQARKPWDQAIVDTRAGLKGASAAVDRAQAGVAPVMQGTMRGQDMLAQSDRASLDAARDAAMLKQAQDAQAMARSLGISESAATEAGAAANISTQAEAAGQLGDVDRRTDNAKGLASSIQQASTLGAQETKQNLIRDNEREINRLRAQRSMGMAQARGSVEQEIAEFIREQAGATNDAALERTKLGISLMNAISGDALQREGQATTRRGQDISSRDRRLAAQASMQPKPLDILSFLNEAGGAARKVPMLNEKGQIMRTENGGVVMTNQYADPAQIGQIASMFGPQYASLFPKPQAAPAGGGGGLNSIVKSALGWL